jgi:hypothetical protein
MLHLMLLALLHLAVTAAKSPPPPPPAPIDTDDVLVLDAGIAGTRTSSTAPIDTDVLVLGAGIAGARAAQLLADADTDFLVLEQSGRVGGRMWNVEWEGRTIELGANWIEGIPQKEDVIWTIAQEIGLEGNYTSQEADTIQPTLFTDHGQVPSVEQAALQTRFNAAMEGAMDIYCDQHRAHGDKGDLSLREALTRQGWPRPGDQTALERTLEFFVVDWDFEFPPEVSLYEASASRLSLLLQCTSSCVAVVCHRVRSLFSLRVDCLPRCVLRLGEEEGERQGMHHHRVG